MLWIALLLPELPLQLAQRGQKIEAPCVIADGPSLRPLVRCANTEARERGVLPDMSVAAARSLAGELMVLPRDTAMEEQALHNLCCWAGQFTPTIVRQGVRQEAPQGKPQEEQGLLLEVDSTLRLHGGLARLLLNLRQGLVDLGYHAEPGVAPTPRAAWLFASARRHGLKVRMCLDAAQLPQRLDALPVALLDWPPPTLSLLHSLGITRIGQCLALPRDGFIRRFGYELRLVLDQMLGTAADPRPCFVPPEHFTNRLEFGFEVAEAPMLLFPLKRLLQELEGFLRGRGAGVQQWHLKLEHMNHGRSTITVGTASPERSAVRLFDLTRERLMPATLIGPVLAMGINADQLLVFAEHNRSLIPDPRSHAVGWSHLVDKLAARLGSEQVQGLRARDDHRPELAWRRGSVMNSAMERGTAAVPRLTAPRPLWLLPAPRLLMLEHGQPLHHGRLHLVAGPERIEAGWWDAQFARRDYYVARNRHGETLWIYREHRAEHAWFLHGIFS